MKTTLLPMTRTAALLACGIASRWLQTASAQSLLFATQEDFSGWGNNGNTNETRGVSALDSGGGTIDGLG